MQWEGNGKTKLAVQAIRRKKEGAPMMTGEDLIDRECFRLDEMYDFTYVAQDDHWTEFQDAASGYLMAEDEMAAVPGTWPWAPESWDPKDRLTNLVLAGALFQYAADYQERSGGRFGPRSLAMAKLSAVLIDSYQLDEP